MPRALRLLPCALPVASDEAVSHSAVLPCGGLEPGNARQDPAHSPYDSRQAGRPAAAPAELGRQGEARQGRRGAPEPLQRGACRSFRGDEPHDPFGGQVRPTAHLDGRRAAGQFYPVDGPEHPIPRPRNHGQAGHECRNAGAPGEIPGDHPGEDARVGRLHPPPGAEPAVRAVPARQLAVDRGRAAPDPWAERLPSEGGAGAQDRHPRGEERAQLRLVRRRGLQDVRVGPGGRRRRRLVPRRAGRHRVRGLADRV
mmetsp:Transcript_63541/g.171457  ORF Transcript_63541/g.171457 Transcript_63541/m.171457 type:complete len:255 (+) Transcript_63541:762-1526(+)